MSVLMVGYHSFSTTLLFKMLKRGTSLVVQWLRLCASTSVGMGSIPDADPDAEKDPDPGKD